MWLNIHLTKSDWQVMEVDTGDRVIKIKSRGPDTYKLVGKESSKQK